MGLDVCEVVPPQVVLAAASSRQVKFEELFNGVASYQQRVSLSSKSVFGI